MSNLKRNNNTSDDSINNHASFNKKTDKEQLFINKCEVLANTILNLQPLYLNEEYDDKQRAYIETMVGAGLWYLSKGIWTGNMSISAIELYLPQPGEDKAKYTEDHEYPRKVSGMELLKRNWDVDVDVTQSLIHLYNNKYGKVNYVTKNENSRLTKFQRVGVFTTPLQAYENAEINLVEITYEQLIEVKKCNGEVIEEILSNNK